MDDTTKVILILLGIAFLLLAGFAVPVLLQLLRTARKMTLTLDLLNERLPKILKNLEEITEGINRTTVVVHRQVEEFSATVKKVQGTVTILVGLEEILRRGVHLPFAQKFNTALAVARGIRVFMDHLLRDRPGRKA
jgi:predicted PurR-regulated permease PerM